MPERLNVSPTRGVLLQLKESLKTIRSQHDLLERKREVLVRELLQRLKKAEEVEKQSLDLFRKAHQALQLAAMRMGTDRLGWICLAPLAQFQISTGMRSIMGLKIPTMEIDIEPFSPPYGLGDTSAALDAAGRRWIEVVQFLGEASAIISSVWRLAMELRKTRRQVNAIESVIIPRYEVTISFITNKLEEEERDDIVYTKEIKQRKKAESEQASAALEE